MNEEQKLQTEIKELEAKVEPLKKRLHDIWEEQHKVIEVRIKEAELGRGNFSLDELIFAAKFRCDCGAGMAYPEKINPWGAWYCSDILHGTASREKKHKPAYTFAFYEIKSEGQPSANGATTRPPENHPSKVK